MSSNNQIAGFFVINAARRNQRMFFFILIVPKERLYETNIFGWLWLSMPYANLWILFYLRGEVRLTRVQNEKKKFSAKAQKCYFSHGGLKCCFSQVDQVLRK